eukprot:Skav206688  [mRNA]  locus=scaffold1764:34724:35275:+ [translate_table: standard]
MPHWSRNDLWQTVTRNASGFPRPCGKSLVTFFAAWGLWICGTPHWSRNDLWQTVTRNASGFPRPCGK